jgi:hypothetical protein
VRWVRVWGTVSQQWGRPVTVQSGTCANRHHSLVTGQMDPLSRLCKMVRWKWICVSLMCCLPLAVSILQDGVGRESVAQATNGTALPRQENVLDAEPEYPNRKRKSSYRQEGDDAVSRRNLARRNAYHNNTVSLAIRRADLKITLNTTRPYRRAHARETTTRNRASAR